MRTFYPDQSPCIAHLISAAALSSYAVLSQRGLVEEMRNDRTTPATRLSDDMNHINPAHCTDSLVELMLGGMPVGRIGYPLHCRVRYFDLQGRRAGLPEGIASLVHAVSAAANSSSLLVEEDASSSHSARINSV